jgi:exopolysaccharide biosynthesis protein
MDKITATLFVDFILAIHKRLPSDVFAGIDVKVTKDGNIVIFLEDKAKKRLLIVKITEEFAFDLYQIEDGVIGSPTKIGFSIEDAISTIKEYF